MLSEFKEFISRGNVMDMAVGIIMGAAFTTIVNSMVGDLIMPVIGVLTSGVDFADKFIALNGETYVNLKAAKAAGAPVVSYGVFINSIINFVIVSFAIFMLVKGVNNLKRKHEEKAPGKILESTQGVVLLTEIRDLLARK